MLLYQASSEVGFLLRKWTMPVIFVLVVKSLGGGLNFWDEWLSQFNILSVAIQVVLSSMNRIHLIHGKVTMSKLWEVTESTLS